MSMNDGDRRAALEMHALGRQDREWILGRLDRQERARIEPLLSELDALGIRFDGDPADLQDAPQPTAKPAVAVNGHAYAAAAVAEPMALLRNAGAGDIIRALEHEPQWLVDCLLSIDTWPWSAAVRTSRAAVNGRNANLRVREPASATRSGPALNSALAELLAARLQIAVAASASGGTLNGYRAGQGGAHASGQLSGNGHTNGHDRARDLRSRFGRIVTGVRQWLP
jgi:hypothetical protein